MIRAAVLGAAAALAISCPTSSAQPQLHTIATYDGASPPTTNGCLRHRHRCYQPAQLQRAYDMAPLLGAGTDGRGRTIVVVDSFGSPTIHRDLKRFDRAFGLPDPPSLRVYSPAGAVPRFSPRRPDMGGWADETTLDVEWSHVFAPGAKIVVLQTPVSQTEGDRGMPQMMDAIRWALRRHIGDVISMSFGSTEQTFRSNATIRRLRSVLTAATAAGVGLVSASGDTGATAPELNGFQLYPFRTTQWPASDPVVLGVGGTDVTLDESGNRLMPDAVWSDSSGATGGGLSVVFGRPSYQDPFAAVVGAHRGVPDISISGGVMDGVDVYLSFLRRPRWAVVGGTSASAVEMAGLIADADQLAGHSIGDLPAKVYALTSGIVDVTAGNDTFGRLPSGRRLLTVRGFEAAPGYDLASGLGTVDAGEFVPALARIG